MFFSGYRFSAGCHLKSLTKTHPKNFNELGEPKLKRIAESRFMNLLRSEGSSHTHRERENATASITCEALALVRLM